MSEPIKNRYEFVMLYDVENGNPNGDPDAGNMPRIDPETGHGIVTDVCIKRKIRDYVQIKKEQQNGIPENGFDIFVLQDNIYLNDKSRQAIDSVKSKTDKTEKSADARKFMCDKYYDIRAFGAVLTAFTKKDSGLWNSSGQVRGPVQLAFGKSIDPIVPSEISITRVAISDKKEEESRSKNNAEDGTSTMMGRKHIIPYALYRQEGFISANLARKVTGFSDDDLQLLWTAVQNMFEFDRSAARGKMTFRKLIIFKHESELGNASAQKLFDLVTVKRIDESKPARSYSDYDVQIGTAPNGVTIL